MLRLATFFLIATLIAALFGFGRIYQQIAPSAQIMFFVFLGFYLLFLMTHTLHSVNKGRRLKKVRNQR